MLNNIYDIIPFKAQIVEDASAASKGRMVVEGVFQACDKKNANGRYYPKALWEKVLKNENVAKALQERRMFGELDHPQDGRFELKRTSHIILNHWMNENGEICGRAEILDTPNGKILQELFNAGTMVGISSRGSGSVKQTDRGLEVQEDFHLDTYDFVCNPSTFGAFPKQVSENTEKNIEDIKEKSMNAQEKLRQLEDQASAVLKLSTKMISEELKPLIDNTTSTLVIELTKLATEAPELKNLTEGLISDLNDTRRALRATVSEKEEKENPFEKMKKKKKGEKDDGEKEDVEEETSGTIDSGVHRSVPKEATPSQGQGWPINPADAGVLAGINNGVDEFMSKSQNVIESEEDEVEDSAVSENDLNDRDESLKGIAYKLINLPETETNSVARAFAAAYLMESGRRQNENQAYQLIIGKMQEKFAEAKENGVFLVEGDEEVKEQLEATLASLEELRDRHRLLASKYYAEQELDKLGLKNNIEARKLVAEAIRKSPTKTAIDEAIVKLAAVKGFKLNGLINRELKEDVNTPPAKNLEGAVAKLAESTSNPTKLSGAELGKRLSEGLRYSTLR